jgi:glycogen(starch) synthase
MVKVLMLGWEFPPYNAGGLGIACEGIVKSLVKQGAQVTFVMPKAPQNASSDFCNLLVANQVTTEITTTSKLPFEIKAVESLIHAYMGEIEYKTVYQMHSDEITTKIKLENIDSDNSEFSVQNQYGKDLYAEVWRYAQQVKEIAIKSDFDIIHAHDWHSFQAGMLAKDACKKPLVIHIHNTAFDRSGGNPNPHEYAIEREGFAYADKIIAISNLVKNTLTNHYAINPAKIEVIHNGIDIEKYQFKPTERNLNSKMVLFAGRVTLQKGPDYFVEAAHKICQKRNDVQFVVAGTGDMMESIIERVAQLGMAEKFIFHGRYSKEEGDALMSMADVFVMPSVSEPFGLVPLEAMIQKTPTVISKQSGVGEVVSHTLKADFWDTDQLANKIHAALEYGALSDQLSEYGATEAENMTWDTPSSKMLDLFKEVKN